MTDPERQPGDAEARPADRPPPRMPRWVLITLVVVGVLVAVLIVLELSGVAGDHGPGGEPPVEHGS